MAVRVRLTVSAAPGGVHTASEPVGMTLQGDTVSVLLAGIDGTNVSDDVSNWHTGAPPVQFAKRVVVKVKELVAAKVSTCEDLGRFAFATSFGVDAAPYKVYGRMRCAIVSAPHLALWYSSDQQLMLEPTSCCDAPGGGLMQASDTLEVAFYFDAREMAAAWRWAAGTAYDSCMVSGKAADARFSSKLFAKSLGTTEAKVDAAMGRLRGVAPNHVASCTPPPAEEPVCLDAGLLRDIEAKVAALYAGGFATLCEAAGKRPAAPNPPPEIGGDAENAGPNALVVVPVAPSKPKRARTNFNSKAKEYLDREVALHLDEYRRSAHDVKQSIEARVRETAENDSELEASGWGPNAVANAFKNALQKERANSARL